jgi:alpha-amylase/alpha-mannosidase (GH57 family)
MDKHVCVHGHFYQPPRENPWLNEVELQDSAYPYHDWNARITEECYAPITASRILDGKGRIVDIVNLYSRISFNFGPTLLSWLERRRPDIYEVIIEADGVSRERHRGHGSAMAQVYNHMIMPLATRRDKVTQTIWGIRDFQHRFGRDPEGMWLPETAADLPTLEVLAEQGIRFTVLAPRQAKKIRRLSSSSWTDVNGGTVDPTRPYLCRLPSGKEISIFFYDGPVSEDIAFRGLLSDGRKYAERLLGAVAGDKKGPALLHVATDGETYGHHHRGGDMALAYCLHYIESNDLATLTNYGEYLETHPPAHEVVIHEGSSWSCVHGVERWRRHCGCHIGGSPGWTQKWRTALREAMDWLSGELAVFYEREGGRCFGDPWKARDSFIDILHSRDDEEIDRFMKKAGNREMSREDKARALKLLELQKNAQLIFTSCGWFFDDISGIETVQILRYAAQAIQYLEELGGPALESKFLEILEKAPGNVAATGADVYRAHVRPAVVDSYRVAANYGIKSLFNNHSREGRIHCYSCSDDDFQRLDAGRVRLVTGKVKVVSDQTWDEEVLSFAVLHLGDQNIHCGVRKFDGDQAFAEMKVELSDDFAKGDVTRVLRQIDWHFMPHTYSLFHLFKDEQRKVVSEVLRITYEEIDTSYRQVVENNYPLMNFLTTMEIPLPRPLKVAAEYVANRDLRAGLVSPEFDGERFAVTINEIKRWALSVDREMAAYTAGATVTSLMEKVGREGTSLAAMETARTILEQLKGIKVDFNLWKAQNTYFSAAREVFPAMSRRSAAGEAEAGRWVEVFENLGRHLGVRIA